MKILLMTALVCLSVFSSPSIADSQRPSTVEGVSAVAIDGPAVMISWNKPWDNVGIDGYNLYRDGNYFTTVRGTTNYLDRNVSSDRGYSYTVVAFDSARNYSIQSSNASTSSDAARSSDSSSSSAPPSSGTPAAPDGLRSEIRDSSTAKILWNEPSGGAEGYNVYRNGHYFTTVKSQQEYTATSLESNRDYTFEVAAYRYGRYSSKSSTITVRTSGDSISSRSQPDDVNNDSAVPSGYNLVFSDEFERSSVDTSKWNTRYRWGPEWIINNEQQYYVDTANDPNFGATPFKFNGNRLTIEASKTPDWLRSKARDQKYLSGAMTTYNKFRMKYGYVEMRARLPKGNGLWPAFWLLHESNDQRKPEIDVMEMLGNNTRRIYQTYHYYDNGNLRSTPSFQAEGADYSDDFHTFGMLWEPGRITWYVDGVQTNRYESGNVADESMYLLVNLALGGNWAGSPDESTSFPAKLEIDYVRAYQQ